MKSRLIFTLLIAVFASSGCGQQVPPRSQTPPVPAVSNDPNLVKVSYVGNEGVLLSHRGKAVLIDGLHREYRPAYLFPPPELLSAMETAKPPFDQVRVVLVSHVHLDHFHPESVGLHLRNNKMARLVSSPQTMLEVGKSYGDHEAVRSQTIESSPEWKQRRDHEVDGIKLSVLGMRHSGERFWWVKNLGHLIELGGKKFFHFGDADMTDENFAAFDLPKEKIDVAFVPYWFLLSDEGRKLVRDRIAPRSVVAVHISPGSAQTDAVKIREAFPDATPLITIRQEIEF